MDENEVVDRLLEDALLETVEHLAMIFLAYGHAPDTVYGALVAMFKAIDPEMKPPFANMAEAHEYFSGEES